MNFSRRDALKTTSCGFGMMAFNALTAFAASPNNSPLAPKQPHFAPRAKRVIFLCMGGAPSHVDTFDYKPQLSKDSGNAGEGNRSFAKLLGSPWEFKQHGQSGLPISELFPHLAKHADDLCLINSMHTDIPNHPQAFLQLHTGNFQFVRPSMGAWSLYGLGTENDNLPGFITLGPPTGNGGAQNYGSAFLPAVYQGTPIGKASAGNRFRNATEAPPIDNIKNPNLSPELQRVQLDYIKSLNIEKLKRDQHQPEVEGMIASYELAFRMQDEVPKVLDIESESTATKNAYGIDSANTATFGKQCLVARRLAEAGVRFIEVNSPGWDHHRNLRAAMDQKCGSIDQPIAALLADLKQRDMLKDTLVVWSGEFGRTPHGQNGDGRDHNSKGFSSWMAGGGVKGGLRYGATDEYGYQAIEDKVHIHDWHATMLHLMGLDHTKLTYNYAGRDFRLTDVYGRVVSDIIS